MRAQELYRQGRYREAAVAFRRAVAAGPADRTLWLWYGAALVLAGEPEAALNALTRVRGSPLEPYALLWRGAAYEQLGLAGQARAAYHAALQHAGGTQAAYWASRRLRALAAEQGSEQALGALDPSTYVRLALRHNPRLTASEAWRIAQALLAYGQRFDVDPRLVSALVVVESGFNPRAVSPAGALGLGQLMPEVARAVGVRDPFSIEENLYGTVRVLRGHLERFGYHRVDLALAAYNAGSGAVRRHGGIPPFAETRWYVYHVSRLYLRYLGQ
ncbi:MAG: lytic transglycosylase domain-containing protein [Armatimonadota bacterium]|nr:lytic transglycosylase domain-containing protein [Armatimonadota bacterium]MDW8157113.1 lytic transglycosylase domain-containing protein [Armatimonadota bacterium]